jgi:pseudouridine kinase
LIIHIVVVGGCAIDVKARSWGPLAPGSDVPGQVKIICGGVGRNLAKNFALLGAKVGLISAVGDDEFGHKLLSDLALAGVNTSETAVMSGSNTAAWVGVLSEQGDLETGVFDSTILSALTPEVIRDNATTMQSADMICVDGTIPRAVIDAVLDSAKGKPLYLNPASVGAARKLVDCYGRFATVIANRLEVEVLTGVKVDSESAAECAARRMVESGVNHAVVTMGADGIIYADKLQTLYAKAIPAQVADTTGAGDALGATFVMSILERRSLGDTIARALRAAAFTVSTEESVSERVKEA